MCCPEDYFESKKIKVKNMTTKVTTINPSITHVYSLTARNSLPLLSCMLIPVLVMQFNFSIIQASFVLFSFLILSFPAAKALRLWFLPWAD